MSKKSHFSAVGARLSSLVAIALAAVLPVSEAAAWDYRTDSNSPRIYSPQGEYLGNLNNNRYDPNSIANPYGAGSPYRGNGVNNPYSPNYTPNLVPRPRY